MEAFFILWGSILILLAIMVPGFALSYAIFPKKGDIKSAERLGLSFVFGLFPELLVYFIAKNLSIPMTSMSVWGSMLVVTAVGLGVWKVRTDKAPIQPVPI